MIIYKFQSWFRFEQIVLNKDLSSFNQRSDLKAETLAQNLHNQAVTNFEPKDRELLKRQALHHDQQASEQSNRMCIDVINFPQLEYVSIV